MGLFVNAKDVVVPGEALADGMDYLPGAYTYRQESKIIAKRLGLVNIEGRAIKLVPLSGRYLPKAGDKIIVQVFDITMSGWLVKTNSAYHAMLSTKDIAHFVRRDEDLTKYFDIGDYLRVSVVKVTSQNMVDVSMKEPGLTKLSGGRVIKVNPHKVPRIIGKQGSMVSLIKDKTNCSITIGQNCVVWIHGKADEELLAVRAIQKIEAEAHLEGLTDKMTTFLAHGGK